MYVYLYMDSSFSSLVFIINTDLNECNSMNSNLRLMRCFEFDAKIDFFRMLWLRPMSHLIDYVCSYCLLPIVTAYEKKIKWKIKRKNKYENKNLIDFQFTWDKKRCKFVNITWPTFFSIWNDDNVIWTWHNISVLQFRKKCSMNYWNEVQQLKQIAHFIRIDWSTGWI